VNWNQESLIVRSPKTAAKPQHAVRVVPIAAELQPILLELCEATEDGAVKVVSQPTRRM